MQPSRGPSPAPILALLVAAAAFGLGTTLVTDPQLVVPLTFEALFFTLLTFAWVLREKNREVRDWLVRLVILALGARFAAMFVVHFYFSPYFFAPDAYGYERIGAALSNHWRGLGGMPVLQGEHLLPTYYHLNGVFHYLLGDSAMGAVVLNMFVSVWTALLTFKLGRELLGKEIGKTAAVLTAFFPSLVLWSVLNIRDSLAGMAVALTVLYGVRTFRKPRLENLISLGLALVLLTALREYMGFLCLSGLALGAVAAVRPGKLFSTLVGGTVLVLFLSLVADRLDLFPTEVLEDPFASATRMRVGLQQGATSAFGATEGTDTLGGSLLYLPLGFAFLLFAPFPWALNTTLQTAAAPETFLWYPIFLLALSGMRRSVLRGGHLIVIPLAVLVVVTTSYALVEGNFGTAYRHRAQLMPLFFIFAAVGWAALRPWLQKRRRMWGRSVVARRGGVVQPMDPRLGSGRGRRG